MPNVSTALNQYLAAKVPPSLTKSTELTAASSSSFAHTLQPCPEPGCTGFLVPSNGCAYCPVCGFSPCK